MTLAATDLRWLNDDSLSQFTATEGGQYKLSLLDGAIVFHLDHLRRERHELHGELEVECYLPGARTYNDRLSIGSFNVSSPTSRQQRAKFLAERAKTKGEDVDWVGHIEELCQRALLGERSGKGASVVLRDVPRPDQTVDDLRVDGLVMPRRHAGILFGDGGSMKSYLGLYVACELVKQGLQVGVFDWELDAADHRLRLERLYGYDMPAVRYVRCERPLVFEVDRLRRIVRDDQLEFLVLDSVGFASHGPPESAETALGYFQAMRQLGRVGSLHIAHINKSEHGEQKPFGSTFWHASARATWFVKPSEEAQPGAVPIGVFPRKANLGPLQPPVAFDVTFSDDRTSFQRAVLGDVPDLAAGMSVHQRVRHMLKSGALTRSAIAETLPGVKADTVRRVIDRGLLKGQLVKFPTMGDEELIGIATRHHR